MTERRDPVWQAIRTRRAIREFADRPVESQHVERILDAGRRANSSKNLQRWEFIVCRERGHLRDLSKLGPWTGHIAGAAVAIALVTPDPRRSAPLSVMFDLGMAAENMMLAAWELRIGSCPATVYEQEEARRLLGYPTSHHCEYILSFGYPADPGKLEAPPRPSGKRSLEEIVHEELW